MAVVVAVLFGPVLDRDALLAADLGDRGAAVGPGHRRVATSPALCSSAARSPRCWSPGSRRPAATPSSTPRARRSPYPSASALAGDGGVGSGPRIAP